MRKNFWILAIIIAAACSDDTEPAGETPKNLIVSTSGVTINDETGAKLNGEIVEFGDPVSDRGFFYGTTSIPDGQSTYENKISVGSTPSVGKFSAIATQNMLKDEAYYYRAYGESNGVVVLGDEFSFVSKRTTPPAITSFLPASGKEGTLITITGTNFSTTAADNHVWFGNAATGKAGEIVSSTSTEIVVKAPVLPDTLINLAVKTTVESALSATKFHLLTAWKRIADFPGAARTNATGFAVGNFGYVGLGNVTGTEKGFWKYDPLSNTWTSVSAYTSVAPSTANGFSDIVNFSTNTLGYVGVGDFTTGDRGTIAKYDPSQNKWTNIATYGEKVRNAVGFSIDGKAYVGTGINESDATSQSLYQYDAESNKWIKKKDLAGVARYLANTFVIGTKAYVVGGGSCFCGPTAWLKDVWEYDSTTDDWTEKESFPDNVLNPTTFSVNGKGYLLGGVDLSNVLQSALYEYDPATDEWTFVADFPGGARDGAVAFVIDNRVYIGTGRKTIDDARTDFWMFDPANL